MHSNMIHDVPCQASSKIYFQQRRRLSVPGPFQNEDQQQQQLSFLDRSKIYCYACQAKERGGNRCAQRTELSLEQDRSKKLLRGKGNPRAHLQHSARTEKRLLLPLDAAPCLAVQQQLAVQQLSCSTTERGAVLYRGGAESGAAVWQF